jgi:RNA polymerase sigma-70 factor (ECF subfamily)
MQRVFSVAYRLARDPHVAEDLVQETYLRAYRAFDVSSEINSPKAWLLTILYRVFVNRFHRQRHDPTILSPEAFEAALDRVSASTPPPPAKPRPEEIEAALAKLPADFRATVMLVDLEDLTYEQAAEVLGCKIGTVRSRLFRARQLLYVELWEYAKELGYATRSPGQDRGS